jgi:hypothetical protein
MKKICAIGKVVVNVWLMGVYNLNLCFAASKKGGAGCVGRQAGGRAGRDARWQVEWVGCHEGGRVESGGSIRKAGLEPGCRLRGKVGTEPGLNSEKGAVR